MKQKTPVEIIIEKNKNGFWGVIENHGFMPTGYRETIEALLQNIKDCIQDYIEHEGKEDEFWKKVYLKKIEKSFKISFGVAV